MFYVVLLFRTLTFMKKRMSRTNEARKTFKVFDKKNHILTKCPKSGGLLVGPTSEGGHRHVGHQLGRLHDDDLPRLL